MSTAFVDVSLVIVLAATLGILAHILKQPTIVAYLGTGIIVAAFGVLRLNSKDVLEVMATFGITFLLFLVGLEMKFNELRAVGKAIVLTGLGQILFTSVIGYGIVRLLGFSVLESLYIAIALTFSSTIIIVKLLSEKRDLQSLYGRIVVGFLLLQDLVAMLILILLTGFQQTAGAETVDLATIGIVLLKIVLLFGGTIWISRKVIPTYIERIARYPELLFVSSIAWAFGIALLVSSPIIGFSIEIGGFLAGLALAQSAEQFQINARIRPLRDFFIIIFFIVLGSSLVISDLNAVITPAIILSLFVLIGNPLIVMIIMGALGYKTRTSFFASVTVAQISEFSLILMATGLAIGHVTDSAVALVTLVGVVTIMVSTYMVTKSDKLYRWLFPVLKIFERKNHIEQVGQNPTPHQIILIGAHRLGRYLLRTLQAENVLIVDFDPVAARKLQEKGHHVVFGDITDTEVLDALPFESASLVLSTVPSMEDNIAIMRFLEKIPKKKRPSVIVNAQHEWEAKMYYTQGADYVLYPHFVSAQHLSRLFKNGQWDKKSATQLKRHDLSALEA